MNSPYRLGMASVLLVFLLGTSPHCISGFLSSTNQTRRFSLPPSSRQFQLPKSDICHGAADRIGSISYGGSSTALSSTPALQGFSSIANFYKAFPLLAGFLTASTKACLADSMAQYRDVCTTKFNPRRNLVMVLYSGCTLGITCELMYNRIFPMMFGAASPERGLALAIKMTLFDGFVNAPLLWLPPAYIAQALVYRYPFRIAIQKYILDVRENKLLTKYWSVWLPATMINFCFVPPHFRVAFAASVSFFWMIVLSIVVNNNKEKVESPPEELEPTM